MNNDCFIEYAPAEITFNNMENYSVHKKLKFNPFNFALILTLSFTLNQNVHYKILLKLGNLTQLLVFTLIKRGIYEITVSWPLHTSKMKVSECLFCDVFEALDA